MTYNQVKQGLMYYIESEFVSKFPDWRKWGIAIGAAAYINKLDKIFQEKLPMLIDLGYAREDGTLDIEKVYNDFITVAQKQGSINQNVPLIGNVEFTQDDITKIYQILKTQV